MLPQEKTHAFMAISDQFNLGHLVTEDFHPDTVHLSSLVKKDLRAAAKLLQGVDFKALEMMQSKEDELWKLAQDIQETLRSGHKVFLCGCGATGRLSLVLETLFRQLHASNNQVLSFMAGGDYALIKSVESFEDKTEYGIRQLLELGFGPHDLLLASSEGGETPFVIGAVNEAGRLSSRLPYFLYCNPDDLLTPIERSREVLLNHKIKKINLTVGPMAISGSTRMQASTALMLGIGVGLLYDHRSESEFKAFYKSFVNALTQTNYESMAPLTEAEARLYKEDKYLNYVADSTLAISVLTDTTERSPTFSLKGFENRLVPDDGHGLSYLFIEGTATSDEAWSKLLTRKPRALNWPELGGKIDLPMVIGFDISNQGLKYRSQLIPTENFTISHTNGTTSLRCQHLEVIFNWGNDILFNHLMLKMVLNAHSTLIMGLLDRYEGNVMTWVRPSNNKLIDRAARYIIQLTKEKGLSTKYEKVVELIFEEIETLGPNEPIVLKVLQRLNVRAT